MLELSLSSTETIAFLPPHQLLCLWTQASPAILKQGLSILASLSMLSEMSCHLPRVCHIDSLQWHHLLPVGLVLPSKLWFITLLFCSHTTLSSLSHMGLLMRYAWWWLEGEERSEQTEKWGSRLLALSFSKDSLCLYLEDPKWLSFSVHTLVNFVSFGIYKQSSLLERLALDSWTAWTNL